MDDNTKETNTKDAGRVKILLLGESAVGKSSLLAQYIDQDFSQGHMPTIGI
jgi:GTPase SAR1 family protein